MIPVLVPAAAVAVEAVGGFAAAATSSEVLAALISGGFLLGRQIVAKQAAAQTARYALGAAIAPWVGGVLLAGTILYGSYKIIKHLSDKKDNIELYAGKDGLKVKANGRPMTQAEFGKTLGNEGCIAALRKRLKENALQYNMTSQELYSTTLDTVRGNPSFQNVDDADKVKLAKRLTDGLL